MACLRNRGMKWIGDVDTRERACQHAAPLGTVTDFILQRRDQILSLTGQHLLLIAGALLVSLPLGVVLGVAASYSRGFRAVILYVLDLVTTVPSIALFGLLIPWVGLGSAPALIGLVL